MKDERASRNKLKHFLVLLSRLLALAALVLAFAQPYIAKTENQAIEQGEKAVSIYIDNSFSMNALSNDVSLFEKARYKAREIADAFPNDTRFQVLTNDFEGKHQRLLNKDELTAQLDEIQISPVTRKLSDVVERQRQALEQSTAKQKNMFLLSDFQKNIATFENDTAYKIYLIPLQSVEQQNVFVDSVWFATPVRMLNEPCQLLVRVHNTGDADVTDSRLTLRINDQVKSLKDMRVGARSVIIDTLNFAITESGWNKCEVSIIDQPITFDDSYYFAFEIAKRPAVLSINQAQSSRYLDVLMRESNSFDFQNQAIGQLDYSTLSNFRLIVLNGLREFPSGLAAALQAYVEEGGSLLIFPGMDANLDTYNSFLRSIRTNTYTSINNTRREVGKVNLEQEIFKNVFEKNPADGNVDLPFATQSYSMTAFGNTGEEILLSFKDGSSMVSKYEVGNGKVYLSAVSLDTKSSNLPAHAVFVPLIHKVAVVSGKTGQLAYIIGKNDNIEVENKLSDKESVFKMRGQNKEFIPGQKVTGSKIWLSINGQIKESGIYNLFMKEDAPLSEIGFNYDRQESLLQYLSLPELKEKYTAPNISFLESNANLGILVGEIDRGVPLWKWCLLAALAFLLIEILLLRLWR